MPGAGDLLQFVQVVRNKSVLVRQPRHRRPHWLAITCLDGEFWRAAAAVVIRCMSAAPFDEVHHVRSTEGEHLSGSSSKTV